MSVSRSQCKSEGVFAYSFGLGTNPVHHPGDVDECTQPLDRVQPVNVKKDPPPTKRNVSMVANRFRVLSMDGEDDEQSEKNYAAAKESIGVGA